MAERKSFIPDVTLICSVEARGLIQFASEDLIEGITDITADALNGIEDVEQSALRNLKSSEIKMGLSFERDKFKQVLKLGEMTSQLYLQADHLYTQSVHGNTNPEETEAGNTKIGNLVNFADKLTSRYFWLHSN